MAKKEATKRSSRGEKSLVIVESPAKAQTIGKYLGPNFTVEASIGHVRDLPEGAKQVPAQYKGEEWASLGVNVDSDFAPIYVVSPGKTKQVTKLKTLLKEADNLFLATDEDREGEAISWHLVELLKPKVPVKRMVFHEITKEAIQNALANPRDIDMDLVRAQETRRILDRLYGYGVSPLLWYKIRPKLSAGRVQSVAVRMIVEREKARMAFVSATFWDLLGTFAKDSGESFQAGLVSVNGRRIPAGKDFDSATGKIKDSQYLVLDEKQASELVAKIRSGKFKVTAIDDKPYTSQPYAPFTTSTLQQEANRKLGYTARRTMSLAQSLYQNGHITYMRTDSTNLAQVAVNAARDLVREQYGAEFLPQQQRTYTSKVKNAQEAHEAIRPAGHPFELPTSLKNTLKDDEYRIFEMIWKRTIASQMADARGRRIQITIEADGCVFQVGGKTIDFPGYLRAYVEGSDDPNADLADKETVLPSVAIGELLSCKALDAKSHTTQPPARFSEAALTRKLEEEGIGRPSTYATIIDTILGREYAFKKGNALVPTWVAFSVVQLLESHLASLVDYRFTAQMEDDLDSVSRGETDSVDYLRKFYLGDGEIGLREKLVNKKEEIDARAIGRIPIGTPDGEDPVFVRVGRYAPFLEQGERRATLPNDIAPDEVTLELAKELFERAAQGEKPVGYDPENNKPVYIKSGRFGPYVQRGDMNDGEERPQNASLLRGMEASQIDLATALRLLSLPRTLGNHPENSEPVVAHNGRFGPYVKCGTETRSLPQEISPLDVTLEQALELIAQPKVNRRGPSAPREPLRTIGDSEVTKQPIKLFDGRYGPYITDGETNASLPKGSNPAELTLEQALELLAERAAAGPPKKKKRAAPKKKAASAPKKKKKSKS